MKKAIIAIAALFVALSANAQIGVVAGLTSSSTNVEAAVADIKNVNQYHVGITYKIGIGNMLAIQPALIYNVKGTQVGSVIEEIDAFDADFKTGYLELPVQVQLGFGIGSLARVYGFAEPFIGYAITNKVEGLTEISDKWDFVNRLEYGVGLGAGVELFRHLQVSVKYFWNLGNMYNAESELNFGSISKEILSSKCSGIAASVAFLF